MSDSFNIPEKLYAVEIYRCNVATGVVVEKTWIHICAVSSTEAFARAMMYCSKWTMASTNEICFPKKVKLAD